MIDTAHVAENVAVVRRRIEAAGGREVAIVAVTKGFGPDAIGAAVAAGLADIGESYAQETVPKLAAVRGPRPRVHFVGRLQSNKIRSLAPWVDVWQSVDRPSLGTALARHAPGAHVLVQVNVSDEPQKGGCRPDEVGPLVADLAAQGLHVDGLMGVGRAGPHDVVRPGFRLLRSLVDDLGLATCSMGMTDDLEVAVEEGSTMVRVGTALFGERPDLRARSH